MSALLGAQIQFLGTDPFFLVFRNRVRGAHKIPGDIRAGLDSTVLREQQCFHSRTEVYVNVFAAIHFFA